MRFQEIINACEEPANEVFKLSLNLVFDDNDGFTEHIERLSPQARLVYLVWNLDGEIHNGGFDQLFVNSLGNYCVEILKYLKEIGASISADLLEKAMSYFPNNQPPEDRQERLDIWLLISYKAVVEKSLNILDEEYYKYEDNISALLDIYVMENNRATIEA